MLYAEHTISFCESGILLHGKQKVPMWAHPIINPVTASQVSFTGRQRFTCVFLIHWWIKCILSYSIEREPLGLLLAWAGLLRSLPYVPFSFYWFCFYPFIIISYSHEYNYVLCPVDPPNELSDLAVILGISNTSIEWYPSSFNMNVIIGYNEGG